jgi:microcystin-dependent protein
MNVQVAAGMAVVRGCMYRSTATENVLLTAPPSGTRIYMVALELNQTTNAITLVAIAGAGAAEPVVLSNQDTNDTGTFHVPLARVTVASSDVAVGPGAVSDRRLFIGRQVGAWAGPANRPTGPRKGEVGFSAAINSFEFYDGTSWSRVGSVPGEMKMYAGSTLPSGWLLCDGGSHLVATYPDLHAAIGYAFGGAGASFNVPNLVNKVPRGSATLGGVGGTGGANSVTLSTPQMPSHTHAIDHNHAAFDTASGGGHSHNFRDTTAAAGGSIDYLRPNYASGGYDSSAGDTSTGHTHSIDVPALTGTSGATGGTTPVDITPSHLVLNFIIKT